MKNIKELILFISFSFVPFFMNLVVQFSYLFLVTTLSILVFFIGHKSVGNHSIYFSFLTVLVVINFFIRRRLVTRSQLRLNAHYIYWLFHHRRNNSFPPPLQLKFSNPPAQIAADTRTKLKKRGARNITSKLLLAIAATRLNPQKELSENGSVKIDCLDHWDKLKPIPVHYRFIQPALLLILLVFVTSIAYLLTMGFQPALRLLIFPLGFFVVYFLNAGIIDPMVGLLIQKRVVDVCGGQIFTASNQSYNGTR